ncbi:rhodanese-like domain-containing protein [Haloferula sp. BvORR071]|uniref:rhodanese-like domain-containing protein n=1 Tax=Haloferula sp. BvORR071 TaxID=1396141 RepID=UPI0005556FD2|nr:rhodanese-like domain-containing protein [Haloferula sp. BvORR071]
MKRCLLAGLALLELAACEEGQTGHAASVPPAQVVAKPTPPKKAVTPKPAAPTPPAPVPVRGTLTEISLEAFFPRQQAGTALIYDARPGFVSRFGKIPGAISWPKGDFDHQIASREVEIGAAVKAGKIVVVYCTDAACPDARTVAEKLAARGHDVAVLQGGFADWKTAGMPTE